MMVVELIKLEDSEWPESLNIDVGSINLGFFVEEPKVGQRFIINPISYRYNERGLSTSLVRRVIDDNTFETVNSIYKWNIIDYDRDKIKAPLETFKKEK